ENGFLLGVAKLILISGKGYAWPTNRCHGTTTQALDPQWEGSPQSMSSDLPRSSGSAEKGSVGGHPPPNLGIDWVRFKSFQDFVAVLEERAPAPTTRVDEAEEYASHVPRRVHVALDESAGHGTH
ncbi:hypothetical protein BDK51DRAFT_34452, partial [Blyttiomyces helicus]